MLKIKKTIRFLTVIAIVFAMVISIASLPTSAAGTETWYGSYKTEGEISINGSNTTPVKTMGVSGTLKITAYFVPSIALKNVKYVVQIRDLAGRVLASNTFTSALPTAPVSVSLKVTKGQEVRIFFASYDAETGANISSKMSYSHSIS